MTRPRFGERLDRLAAMGGVFARLTFEQGGELANDFSARISR
jgi:hypothetical protein